MKNIISLKSVALLASFVFMAMVFSCTKEGGVLYEEVEYSTNNKHIKSVSANGTIVHKYLYNSSGRIVEENSFIYFNKYLYENDLLVKIESAFDRSMLSSSMLAERRTEFMTSQNSTVDNYSLYKYDNAGRLSKTEHYYNMNGKEFELRSVRTFEYSGLNISKVFFYDPTTGKTSLVYEYFYDNRGNVIIEKYYSNSGAEPELHHETSYKYDNYKNPYQIFSMKGYPGMYTNVNNIIETNLTRHSEVQGFDKYSTSKNTYKYNKSGYPIKVNENGNEFEYQY